MHLQLLVDPFLLHLVVLPVFSLQLHEWALEVHPGTAAQFFFATKQRLGGSAARSLADLRIFAWEAAGLWPAGPQARFLTPTLLTCERRLE